MTASHMHGHMRATTTRLRVGGGKAASKHGGYQCKHCSSQHVSPLSLRRVGLGVKLTLGPLGPAISPPMQLKISKRLADAIKFQFRTINSNLEF
jgi:hypothetical protein